MPNQRFTTSRIRRLPACGSAFFAATTASRRGSFDVAGFARLPPRPGAFSRASRPPAWYFSTQPMSVVYGMLNSSATRFAGIFFSTTASAV